MYILLLVFLVIALIHRTNVDHVWKLYSYSYTDNKPDKVNKFDNVVRVVDDSREYLFSFQSSLIYSVYTNIIASPFMRE